MSRNTFDILLVVSVALLLTASIVLPREVSSSAGWVSRGWSVTLSMAFLALICVFLSYMNRAFFVVSSDRITLPLLYLLIVLPDPQILIFSPQHVAALLLLASLFHIFRFLTAEHTDRSDFFLSMLFIACASVMVPRMIWLAVPGVIIALSKVRNDRFAMILITVGALLIPPLYIFSYRYVFMRAGWMPLAAEWMHRAVRSDSPADFRMAGVFYSAMMFIVISVVSVCTVSWFNQVRISGMRKKLNYLLMTVAVMVIMMAVFNTTPEGPVLMAPAIPLSLLFLHYGSMFSFGKGWRHLFLLLCISGTVLKAYSFI